MKIQKRLIKVLLLQHPGLNEHYYMDGNQYFAYDFFYNHRLGFRMFAMNKKRF
ncbi:MAG: hypothetical protein ABIP35_16865 [Ginsengibacter sp.]